jgi:predicted nucleic acid-binding protein
MGLIDAIQGGPVYLDSNVFIYALEGYPEYASVLGPLFEALDSGRVHAVTSELTLAEVLVKPMMMGNQALQSTYQEAVRPSPSLTVLPVSRDVLVAAARIRAESHALRLADAIHASSARLGQANTLLTNDLRLKGLPGIVVLLLSDFLTSS